jgi:nuclear protein localization protein 4 homolog
MSAADMADLSAQISALGILADTFTLHADIKRRTPFDAPRAQNGDFVYIAGEPIVDIQAEEEAERAAAVVEEAAAAAAAEKAAMAPPPSPLADAAKAAEPEPEPEKEEGWKPRCMHGPNGMCEHCMPREEVSTRHERELRRWDGRGMSVAVMEAMDALKFRVKSQDEAHVSGAVVDSAAAAEFQAYVAKTGFSQQRVGVCYGKYNLVEKETRIEVIYEPPQRGSPDTYDVVEGEEAGDMSARAGKLAALLGMSCVGMVISARPRKCILSGKDIVFAAGLLSSLSPAARKSFVILLVSVTESGETAFEAYQLSDQTVEIYDRSIFVPANEQKPNAGRVATKEDVYIEGKETRKVHTEFFLINIPIKSQTEGMLRVRFPVENRDLQPQGPRDVKCAVQTSETISYGKRLADFHLLLFLSSFFDMNTDMPDLAGAVASGSDDVEEGYRLMIDSMGAS